MFPHVIEIFKRLLIKRKIVCSEMDFNLLTSRWRGDDERGNAYPGNSASSTARSLGLLNDHIKMAMLFFSFSFLVWSLIKLEKGLAVANTNHFFLSLLIGCHYGIQVNYHLYYLYTFPFIILFSLFFFSYFNKKINQITAVGLNMFCFNQNSWLSNLIYPET